MRAWILFLLACPLSWAQPDSTFSASTVLPSPVGVPGRIVGDFNLDGRADFVVVEDESLRMYLSGDSGLTKGALAPNPGIFPNISIPGDFNSDGNPDLAIIGPIPENGPVLQQWYRWRVMTGDGGGSFLPGPQALMPAWFFAVPGNGVPGDFDLDGNLDIVIVNAEGIFLLRGDGRGSFSVSGPAPRPVPQQQSFISRTFVADMNGDTRPDIIVEWDLMQFGTSVSVGINDGTGRFSFLPTLKIPDGAIAGIADFTGDQRPDFLTVVRTAYQVWKNSGDGQVTPATTISLGLGSGSAAIADFNLDGLMDFAGSAGQTFVAHGIGAAFSVQFPPIANANWEIYTADFNGDRRPDILMKNVPPLGGGEPSVRLYLNASTRTPTLNAQAITFSRPPSQVFPAAPIALSPTSSSGLPVVLASKTPAICSVWKNTVTMTAIGTCTLTAYQAGNAYWAPGLLTRTFTVAPPNQPQTIAFAPIADRAIEHSPLILSATASSDLPVAFTSSTTARCTVSGTVVTLIAEGTCTIRASQDGDAVFLAAPTVTRSFQIVTPPRIDAIVNAASNVPGMLAPDSYATLYGANLAPSPTLTLRDSAGVQSSLTITYSSATQINFLLPAGVALGSATITITNANGSIQYSTTVARAVPGLFSSSGAGQGPAAANVIIVNADKSSTTRLVTDGPIPVLAGTEVYLVLYGTGIRNATTVTARVAGQPVNVLYAGPQGAYPGLDQINLSIPLTAGAWGLADIQLTVDGSPSNIVTATFQ